MRGEPKGLLKGGGGVNMTYAFFIEGGYLQTIKNYLTARIDLHAPVAHLPQRARPPLDQYIPLRIVRHVFGADDAALMW